MLKILLTQTGWSLVGTIFGFVVGFFVKMYLVNKVGAAGFGLYTKATSFQGAVSTLIAFGIPQVIIKFLPPFSLFIAIFINFIPILVSNLVKIFYAYKRFSTWPLDRYSYFLMGLFVMLLYLAYRYHDGTFSPLHYIAVPLILYAGFSLLVARKLLEIKRVVFAK